MGANESVEGIRMEVFLEECRQSVTAEVDGAYLGVEVMLKGMP